MKEKILAQAIEFGANTRESLGKNAYQPPPNIISDSMDLSLSISHWVNVLGGIAGTIAVGALIWGGILWSMSAGDEEKIERAKSCIKWAVFGMILTLIAWGIVGMIMNVIS
jgi:hypothetical protein